MKLEEVLIRYNFPTDVARILQRSGVTDLYPPQAQAIEKGVLEGKSLLLSVPTAAGKTLIAELCMLKAILQNQGRCLYIAPLKALVSEKYEDFKEKYSPLGIKVGMATGDFDSPNKFLNRYQILVATAEKVDSLLRSRAQWLIHSLEVVVLDEIHFINDGSRGPTLEVLIARIKQLNPKAQIVALSATITNARDLSGWLNTALVFSAWRPVPLKEGVFYNDRILFDEGLSRLIREDPEDDLSKLTLDTLRGKGQVLIFVNSRRSAQATSRQICQTVSLALKPEERKELAAIAEALEGNPADSTKICRKLAEVAACGVAFHHAGLKAPQRKLIEESFKKNLIKVICSTPTLAAGVNLPARRVILRDYKRYESGIGSAYIPISEYKQCAGRAGRPQYDDYGEAVLMAKSLTDSQALFERYIHAKPEPISSKLGDEAALRTHILSSIASGYVHDVRGMFDFISHTFLAYQKKTSNLLEVLGRIFEFLHEENFIEKSGFRYYATAFGQTTSRLYIDPLSGIILRDGLKKAYQREPAGPTGFLHLISCCPDSELLSLGKMNTDQLEIFAKSCQEELIWTPQDTPLLKDDSFYLVTLKTAWLLSRWIEEEKEETLCEDFGGGPGDVYRHVECAQWLLHAAGIMAELFEFKRLTFILEDLKNRVHYGIKEELLELAQLKGVGRVRARSLFQRGFKKWDDFRFSSVEELSQVNHIGKALARDILDQVTGSRRRKAQLAQLSIPLSP